jgi:outer membrane protein TolC
MIRVVRIVTIVGAVTIFLASVVSAQEQRRLILPEQRNIEVRSPEQMTRYRLPDTPPPPTVSQPRSTDEQWELSLDGAIYVGLVNANVIRVVAGTTAVSSGETIYEPAISNTQIDVSRARFDPTLQSQNTFSRNNDPFGVGVFPGPFSIQGTPTNGFNSSTSLSKSFITGGTLELTDTLTNTFVPGGVLPLNPQTSNNVSLGFTQPLLQGGGSRVNLAPILVARLNTERSFFQMKDATQDLVLSIIQTYWNLYNAQVTLWARKQQVDQGLEALEKAKAEVIAKRSNESEEAQAQVSYDNFRAQAILAEANVLTQEALLRNLLGLGPSDPRQIKLMLNPNTSRLPTDWENVLRMAETYRPDIIELKLILEADNQNLIISRNQAMPQLNLQGLYRWNGLEGATPNGQTLSTRAGEFGDWQAGVVFSVPLGLRKERAGMRQNELLIMRDRANLDQAMHSATHTLAANYRNLAQYYEQYLAYERARKAAETNVEIQMAEFAFRKNVLYLKVLQAITDWGNAVTSECQALIQYNTELANLERQTGTILESHGVRFYEERYGSIGPLGRLFADRCYPMDMRPSENAQSTPVPPSEQYHRPEPIPPPGSLEGL